MKPFYEDPFVTIYQANVFDALRSLPSESIQCICTSPPYWSLRKYSGNQDTIWGGKEDCEHLWEEKKGPEHPPLGETSALHNGASKAVAFTSQYSICSKCGAWKGQFGLEPTPEMYIEHTIEVLREIKRVLRRDGTVWWNIGESYMGSWGNYSHKPEDKSLNRLDVMPANVAPPTAKKHPILKPLDLCMIPFLKPLDLCMIPFKVADAAQRDGWWVRSIIVWQKLNPMPEAMSGWRWERHRIKKRSNKLDKVVGGVPHWNSGGQNLRQTEYEDCPGCEKCLPNNGYVLRKGSWRPTESHEYIIMMTKSNTYYGDAEPVREPHLPQSLERVKHDWDGQRPEMSSWQDTDIHKMCHPDGRNIRSVWTFPTQSYPEAHFAVFPEKLPEICIRASTPEVGCCSKCGAPWARVTETSYNKRAIRYPSEKYADVGAGIKPNPGDFMGDKIIKTIGWKPSCFCNADKVPSVVLDPFAGSGTTGKVAKSLGRKAILIDISEEYCKLAKKRVESVPLPMEFFQPVERVIQEPVRMNLNFEEEELPDF